MRPRLTRKEINFIVEALRVQEAYAKQKLAEMEQREWRVEELKREWTLKGNRDVIRQIEQEQAQLIKDRRHQYHIQGYIASILAQRLVGLLQNRILHSSNVTSLYLKTKPS